MATVAARGLLAAALALLLGPAATAPQSGQQTETIRATLHELNKNLSRQIEYFQRKDAVHEEDSCSKSHEDCSATGCCANNSLTCYEKNSHWSACLETCVAGEVREEDHSDHQTPWSCVVHGTAPDSSKSCSTMHEDCSETMCCRDLGYKCYQKNEHWAGCRTSCEPGIHEGDALEHRTPWTCKELTLIKGEHVLGARHGDGHGEGHGNEEQLMMAFCVIDAVQAAISLGQAGTGIAEAVHVCKPRTLPDGSVAIPKDMQDDCAEAILFAITSFGHVGTFLSAASFQCAQSVQIQAYCATNVLDIFTSLSLLAEAGAGISANCVPHPNESAAAEENAIDAAGGRRLEETATPADSGNETGGGDEGSQSGENSDEPETIQEFELFNALLRGTPEGENLSVKKVDLVPCHLKDGNACDFESMEKGTLTAVFPGGNTTCLEGGEFNFKVHPGASDKLLVFFQSGGACWSEETFKMGTCLWRTPVTAAQGLLDMTNEDSPFKDYTVLQISYCSGDFFIGNQDNFWGKQRGLVNMQASIRWASDNFHHLDSFAIAGTSAGSIGGQLLSAYVLQQFKGRYTSATVIPDSYEVFPPSGIATLEDFYSFCESAVVKETEGASELCEKDDVDQLLETYKLALTNNPNVAFVNVDSKLDSTQVQFWNLWIKTNGTTETDIPIDPQNPQRILQLQSDKFAELVKSPNFIYYFVDGATHNFFEAPYVYTTDPSGSTGRGTAKPMLVPWISQILEERIADAVCVGPTSPDTEPNFCDPRIVNQSLKLTAVLPDEGHDVQGTHHDDEGHGGEGHEEVPETTLSEAVEAGATVLNVASQEGFSAGKEVVISGGGNSETRTIASVGSLVLTEPLTHGYPADATITGEPEESEHEVDEKAIATANCVLNILQATSFLARAGTIIAEAVHTCGEAEEAIKLSKLEGDHAGEAEKVAHETEEAINQLDTHAAEHPEEVHTARRLKSQVRVESGTVQQAQKKCAVNILHLISSFSYVASFLSFAVAQCPLAMGDDPESENLEAACAGSIINTITALSATAGSSIDMENSCDLVGQNITTLEENPTSRRLWGARSPKNKADAPFMV